MCQYWDWKLRRLITGFLAFFLLTSCVFAYSFAVFGDNQGNYPVFNDLISKLKHEKGLDFIISVGDFVPYGEEAHYIKYRKIMADLGIPYYQVIGNHDAVHGGWKTFKKYFGPSYYSFSYEGDHFIVLDNAFKQSFDSRQFSWLKEELARPGSRHKFVFMHKPVFDPSEIYNDYVMSGRAVTEELMRLFIKYKVDYVFAGHIHGYARTKRDGVSYVVTGGAGGALHLPPEFGGFYHFIRMDVGANAIKDQLIRVYE